MITAKIIADSVNPEGCRLTTFVATYPRFIHSELMTHRAFSRNAASSRAVPFRKMLDSVLDDPALPEYWGSEKSGMQSGEPLTGMSLEAVTVAWDGAKQDCASLAEEMQERGLHKSLCNRIIEPWSHITTLITATDIGFANFFHLRAHPAAQPEFQVLAYRMLDAYMQSTPEEIPLDGWHIPEFEGTDNFGDSGDISRHLKISTARCARVSYLGHDGSHDHQRDIELHDKLAEAGHWSAFEHCAQAYSPAINGSIGCMPFSNFDVGYHIDGCGWMQYRKMFDDELASSVNLRGLMDKKPKWISL